MKYTRDETTPWLVYKARHLLKKGIQNKLKDYDISSEQWSVLNTVYHEKRVQSNNFSGNFTQRWGNYHQNFEYTRK